MGYTPPPPPEEEGMLPPPVPEEEEPQPQLSNNPMPQDMEAPDQSMHGPATAVMQPPPRDYMPTGSKKGGGLGNSLGYILPVIAGLGAFLTSNGHGGSKMSQALSGLGSGLAGAKVDKILEKRTQKHQQENFMMRQAHDTVGELNGINLDGLAKSGKVPPQLISQLRELTTKYNQALMEDSDGGSIISPKEASDILAYRRAIEPAMKIAKSATGQGDAADAGRAKASAEYGGLVQSFKDTVPQLPSGAQDMGGQAGPPAGPEQIEALAREKASRAQAAGIQAQQPISQTQLADPNTMLPPQQALAMERSKAAQSAQKEKLQRQIAADLVRKQQGDARIAGTNARFDLGAMNKWSAAAANYISMKGVDSDDPGAMDAAMNEFKQIVPQTFTTGGPIGPGGRPNPTRPGAPAPAVKPQGEIKLPTIDTPDLFTGLAIGKVFIKNGKKYVKDSANSAKPIE